MVATIVARRIPSGRRRVATAHTTKAMPRTGIAKGYNKNPIAPPAIDSWTMRFARNNPTIIRAIAPKRSDHARPAKEQPPQDDQDSADESHKHAVHHGVGSD